MTQPLRAIFNQFTRLAKVKAGANASHGETTTSEPILFEMHLDKHEEPSHSKAPEGYQKELEIHRIEVQIQRDLAWKYARLNSVIK
jgi:hypothetical protein